jgi:hypothetical protein
MMQPILPLILPGRRRGSGQISAPAKGWALLSTRNTDWLPHLSKGSKHNGRLA